ncbi:putative metal-dependent hydrolase YjjV [Candidatus Kinetoplastibacterium sorsogonicusi]|uniref:Putative metal-dependent hydrolase YjjV n=1 Tax=Candidatus Kinetoplastidibacterium kentomonadis TaxID=1576550 RepID=A0A3Q8ETM7_9PROT|nr:TatD family hydrolase [Candidatus Kinetoplastibacterium sorsogonicusi]AWD32413.1 putative metal-dependent hydrolase YjjV [Candidatus Kinetoplastibacterium sorsogonicusi]
MFIDSHCHLDFFKKQELSKIISDNILHNVGHIVIPTINFTNFNKVINIAKYYNYSYTIGIHPLFINQYKTFNFLKFKNFLVNHKDDNHFVGIGEIGLDFSKKNNVDINLQEYIFLEQIKVAKNLNFPLIIHAVKSYDRVLKYLRKINFSHGGIIHSFHGSYQQAMNFIQLGFFLGVSGTITYKNANKIKTNISLIDNKYLVLETDSPFIPPSWLFNQKNEPKEIVNIAKALSNIKNITLCEIEKTTTFNILKALPRLSKLI